MEVYKVDSLIIFITKKDDSTIQLGGEFTLEDLKELIKYMEK